MIDRRHFLLTAGRLSFGGLLVAVLGRLKLGTPRSAHLCNGTICTQCGQADSCLLPTAQSYRRAKSREEAKP
jgi:hypothetical protein